jgi:hypothetical protein
MSRSRVQVLTLAEIAFTMLFAVIILSLPQIIEGRRIVDEREKLKQDLERTQAELAEANRRIDTLEQELKKTGKLSNIPPRCVPEPLDRVTVISPNELLVGDERFDAQMIASKHADDLRQAQLKECRHFLVVSWRDTLPASDLDAALRQLERHFYIQRAGSVAIP